MKRFLKNKIILVALVLFFIIGVTVGAATKYYEHVWTNEVKDVVSHNGFVTNDVIETKDGFVAIGFENDNDDGRANASVRVLTKDGLLKKEVTLDNIVSGYLKKILKIDDGYLIFGVAEGDHYYLKLSEDFKLDAVAEDWLYLYSDLDFYYEEDDNYYYIISDDYDFSEEADEDRIIRLKKDFSVFERVEEVDFDDTIRNLVKDYAYIYSLKNVKIDDTTTRYYSTHSIFEYGEGHIVILYSGADETYDSIVKYVVDGEEVWSKKYDNMFIKDGSTFEKKILMTMADAGDESNGTSYIVILDEKGEELSKDEILNYSDADVFYPEHIITTGKNGFALTGSIEYLEEDEVPDGGAPVGEIVDHYSPNNPVPPPSKEDEENGIHYNGETPPPKPNGNDVPPDAGTSTNNSNNNVPNAGANGEYDDDYMMTAQVLYFNIIHQVTTKTDGNGTVVASHTTASWGDAITYTITPNEGFVLGTVKVYDVDGNPIDFEMEGNSFTMPNADVVIDVTFTVENVETITFMSISIIIVAVISAIVLIKARKKAKFYEV